jgi:hypothetical protein
MSRPAEPSRERAWRFWRETLKEPRFVCAPMVLQSELAFRMLVRAHGCQLCYTPMIPASTFLEHGGNEWLPRWRHLASLGNMGRTLRSVGLLRDKAEDGYSGVQTNIVDGVSETPFFTTCPEDRPLIAQIAGHDVDQLLEVRTSALSRIAADRHLRIPPLEVRWLAVSRARSTRSTST